MASAPSSRSATGAVDSPVALSAQYLTFTLGEEVFRLDIRSEREIIQYGAMTAVPLMPDFVRGVINLRGAVVPVIDLHAALAAPRRPSAR